MAIDAIVVRFAVAGVPEVTAAFASVSAQVRRFEEQATRESQQGGRARVRTAQDEQRAKEKVLAKVQAEAAKAEKQQTREAEKETKLRVRATEQAGKAVAKEAEKAAKAEQKAAAETTRALEREEERRMRIRVRSSEMAGQLAAKQAAEEIRAAEKVTRARGAAGRRIGGIVSGSVGSLIGGVGSMVGATLGLGGGFMLANAARNQFSAEHTAALLVNAGTTGGVAPGTTRDALGAASAESVRTGLSKEDLLGSALKYSQSAKGGDFKGALANMGMFADLAKVTGADITDVAESAGILQSQNAELQGEGGAAKMRAMMLTVLGGTHEGSMSFADVAKQMGTMGATRSSFAQDQGKSQLSLIGMGQIARVGGDVGEAGTFVKDLSLEASMANKKWREMTGGKMVRGKMVGGQDLIHMNEHGQMQSPEQLVSDVLRGTKGNVSTINELFGKRGAGLFRELSADYLAGEKTGGVEGGVQAALGAIKKVSGASVTEDQFAAQVKTIDETPGEKFKIALNRITTTIEDKLEPRMEHFASDTLPKLIPKFEAIIDKATAFADWFADNPIKGVGAVVLAKVGADLMQAGIGAAVKSILSSILRGAAGGGLGSAVPAAVAVPVAATLLAYGTETAAIADDTDISSRRTKKANAESKLAADIQKKIAAGGKVTDADLLKLNSIKNSARQDVVDARSQVGKTSAGYVAVGASEIISKITGGPSLADATIKEQQAAAATVTKAFSDVTKAADAAAKALAAQNFVGPPQAVPAAVPNVPQVPIPQRAVQ